MAELLPPRRLIEADAASADRHQPRLPSPPSASSLWAHSCFWCRGPSGGWGPSASSVSGSGVTRLVGLGSHIQASSNSSPETWPDSNVGTPS